LFVFYRKLDVNFFVNNFMKKNNYNIYLLYFLVINDNNNKESFVTYKLYYSNKYFIVIEIFLLFKVANYLLNLVLYYLTINLLLKLIDLFVLENVFIFRYCYNNLDTILFIKFYFIILS
jgi:hypothetical protein